MMEPPPHPDYSMMTAQEGKEVDLAIRGLETAVHFRKRRGRGKSGRAPAPTGPKNSTVSFTASDVIIVGKVTKLEKTRRGKRARRNNKNDDDSHPSNNNNTTVFHLGSNGEVVNHATNTELRLHSLNVYNIRVGAWYSLTAEKGTGGGGISSISKTDAAQLILAGCHEHLPTNVLTHGAHIASVLNYLAREYISPEDFQYISSEARQNRKMEIKIKIWHIIVPIELDEGALLSSVSHMVHPHNSSTVKGYEAAVVAAANDEEADYYYLQHYYYCYFGPVGSEDDRFIYFNFLYLLHFYLSFPDVPFNSFKKTHPYLKRPTITFPLADAVRQHGWGRPPPKEGPISANGFFE